MYKIECVYNKNVVFFNPQRTVLKNRIHAPRRMTMLATTVIHKTTDNEK